VPEQPGLSFAALLRQLRAEARLTQEELAEAARLSPRSVSDLERGINRTARKDTALLLAGALGLDGPARELFVTVARGQAPAAELLAAARGEARGISAGREAELAWLLQAVIDSPYRGLAAFEEQDAGFFFGRETATTQILERISRPLAGTGLLAVSGASGAGKSSLLRAGVLPRVRRAGLAPVPGAGSWACLLLTPTHAPLDELALRVGLLAGLDAAAVRQGLAASPEAFALTARQAALAWPHVSARGLKSRAAERDQRLPHRLLLVVDQFEELFTQCADEGQQRAFITALHAAATTRHGPDQRPAALVVLGVRADFEARCADYPQLAGAVQDRYLVTPMTERQLRMAITEPAKKAGSEVDDDLVEVLLTEARTRQPGVSGAGMLPLLSHALDQAWRSRTGDAVTIADYERTGGIEGAVASSAQRAYDRLTPSQQAAARQVFTRLTATSSDGVDTADRVTTAELTDGKTAAEVRDVETVLEAFAAERLLTLAADTVEMSHEVLLTAWPLLRDTWLADTHADRIVRTRLHSTAAEWTRRSRDPSYLYTGTLLQAATDTAARIGADPAHHPPLSQTERDFLHASQRSRRRRTRSRQGLVAFLVALLIGLTTATVLAVGASQQAAYQREIRKIAVSELLIWQSQAQRDTNPTLSKLLSVAAWRIYPSNKARYAMLAALAAAVRPRSVVFTGLAGPVFSVAFSRDGKILATGDADGIVWLRNLTGYFSGIFISQAGPIYSMVFPPDGKTLISGSANGTFQLWSLDTGRQIGHDSRDYPPRFATVAVSPDGKTLASGNANGTVWLWDAAIHRPITFLTGRVGRIYSVAFSPDGKMLAAGGADGIVRMWDVAYLVDIVPHLCALAGRSLTRAEWARYVPLGTGYQKVCP
jgi:transcriptional regulator with XRE-family HTH domain